MIWKEADDRESDIAQLEQLSDVASVAEKTRIKKQIANIRAGCAGEREAAHFLRREFGESQRMGMLHDLRLELDGEPISASRVRAALEAGDEETVARLVPAPTLAHLRSQFFSDRQEQ